MSAKFLIRGAIWGFTAALMGSFAIFHLLRGYSIIENEQIWGWIQLGATLICIAGIVLDVIFENRTKHLKRKQND